ncbi:MAG: hypothetical protein H0V44_01585 [Planctomycetes bacterium]|nr:hypothetical protein [Planctomycetota bacterium]
MHLRPISIGFALMVSWSTAFAAEQVELHLVSGKTITGELISEDKDQVVVKSTMASKSGAPMTMSTGYKRVDIKEVVRVADPETTYTQRNGSAKSATEHAALAIWCREHGMAERALEHTKAALAADPWNADAAKLMNDLGWVLENGTWIKEEEWLAAQGKVKYQGTIMTLAEVEEAKAQEKREQVAKAAQQTLDDKTATLAALDKKIADLQTRPAELEADLLKSQAGMKEVQTVVLRVEMTKTALDMAQGRLAEARSREYGGKAPADPNAGKAGAPAPVPQKFAAMQKAIEDAQKDHNAAKRASPGAEQELARLKAHIAALTAEKAALNSKAAELKASRPALAKEVDKAKAALDAAIKESAVVPTPSSVPVPPASP